MTTSPSSLDAFLNDVSQSQLGWPDSLRFTYDTTRRLLADGVKGDLVECGVAAGVHPACMARACQDAGEVRSIRLFDSFQGVPNGRADVDVEWSQHYGDGSGRLEPTGVAAASLADVQANLARWGCDGDLFTFYCGWFQSVVPAVASAWRASYEAGESEGIAFLRLDGDLYDSTLTCLQGFWPLMVPGSVLCVDDLNLEGCRQAVSDYFGFMPAFEQITEAGDGWIVASEAMVLP